ncbi:MULTISPECIES: hypothetical protein [Clostridium]|nr:MULTISPECIES: hypothetical protein [Clostridium]MDD7796170.1 hypothetical protein [Clostridium sp. 'White wine YQ']
MMKIQNLFKKFIQEMHIIDEEPHPRKYSDLAQETKYKYGRMPLM